MRMRRGQEKRDLALTRRKAWQLGLPVGVLALLFLLLSGRQTRAVGDMTISSVRTFDSLDGSADDDDGVKDGTFTKNAGLFIANGGSIRCTDADPGAAGGNACNVRLAVSGDMEIQAGGSIDTQNLTSGGHGGDIAITVGGNFTMFGPSGAAGALITSEKHGNGTDHGGAVTIIVGGVTVTPDPVDPTAPGIGHCQTPVGDIVIENGAVITSDAVARAARRGTSPCMPATTSPSTATSTPKDSGAAATAARSRFRPAALSRSATPASSAARGAIRAPTGSTWKAAR